MQKRKLRPLLPIILLVFASFFQLLTVVSPVYAAGPIDKSVACGDNGSHTSITCTISSVPSGDVLVVGVGSAQNATVTISDNATGGTNVYTKELEQDGTGANKGFYRSIIWSATPKSTHGLLITITQAGAASTMGGWADVVSGIKQGALATATRVCNSACGTSGSTTTSISSTNNFIFSITYQNNIVTPGSSTCCTIHNPSGGNSGPFALDSVVQSGNVNFDFHTNGAMAVETIAAASFGVAVVVTTVTACNFFQLQCWWYPLLFMMLYAGVLMLVATQLNTSAKGKAHIFLSAVTFGSLIAVILGIMNIVFPLLMLVINTIIALRLRG